MTRKPKHPWDAIRLRYVQGNHPQMETGAVTWPTLADLAREFGINPVLVSRQANQPGPDGKTWQEQRQEYQRDLQRQLKQKTVETLAGQFAGFNGKLFQSETRLLHHVDRSLVNDDHSASGYNQLASALVKLDKVRSSLAAWVKEETPEAKVQEEPDDWTLLHRAYAGEDPEDIK